MKLVRLLCSFGNGLLGLSRPKPSGWTCSLHCQGNLFIGQRDPAHQGPQRHPCVLPPPASPSGLDNSHYGSNFSRLHLGGRERESKREGERERFSPPVLSDSPGCCICHPLTKWTCSPLPVESEERNDVKSDSSWAAPPEPVLICLLGAHDPWNVFQTSHYGSKYF